MGHGGHLSDGDPILGNNAVHVPRVEGSREKSCCVSTVFQSTFRQSMKAFASRSFANADTISASNPIRPARGKRGYLSPPFAQQTRPAVETCSPPAGSQMLDTTLDVLFEYDAGPASPEQGWPALFRACSCFPRLFVALSQRCKSGIGLLYARIEAQGVVCRARSPFAHALSVSRWAFALSACPQPPA